MGATSGSSMAGRGFLRARLGLLNALFLMALRRLSTGMEALSSGPSVLDGPGWRQLSSRYPAILTKVKAAKPDVLGAATYVDDVVAIMRQMKELDVNVKMFGSTVGGDLPEFYKVLGKTAEYVYGASLWEPSLPYPGAQAFAEAFEKEFGRPPSYHSAAAYAGCQLFVDAARKSSGLEPDKLRAELKLRTRTVFGDYAVDERGFQIGHKGVTIQWQDGEQVVVWPQDVAGGKARFPTPPWDKR
jgi:branched-chain amino acid transport system substrate-binding protein